MLAQKHTCICPACGEKLKLSDKTCCACGTVTFIDCPYCGKETFALGNCRNCRKSLYVICSSKDCGKVQIMTGSSVCAFCGAELVI